MDFKRDEIVGIGAALVVAVIFFGIIRFDVWSTVRDALRERTSEYAPEIVDISEMSGTSTRARRMADALSARGKVEKIVIQDTKKGSGDMVTEGARVTVHYIGTLEDGTVFDNSYEKGMPYSFVVGEGKVIRGWEVGLLGMQVGGERILVIPKEYGYGTRDMGVIPPNSTLLFSVELLSIE